MGPACPPYRQSAGAPPERPEHPVPALLAIALVLAALLAASSAAAQNLLVNPYFDDGLAPWQGDFDGVTYLEDQDHGGCAESGAALMEIRCSGSEAPFTYEARMFSGDPCIALPPGVDALEAVVHYRYFIPEGGTGLLRFEYLAYTTADCSGEPDFGSSDVQSLALNNWSRADYLLEPPDGTQSIVVFSVHYELTTDFACISSPPPIYVDSIYLGVMPPIFAHGFESGEICPFTTVE